MTSLVQVFTRAPVLGRVKTRLAASIGDERALALHRATGSRALQSLTSSPHEWTVEVRATPDDRASLDAVWTWLQGANRVAPQGEGDIGDRMARASLDAFARGYSRVVLVGTDCPAVDDHNVAEALARLDANDAVLGPSLDGGYWLLALARPLAVFEGVAWSTSVVAEQTRSRLRALGARWTELPPARDLDTLDDLEALGGYEAVMDYCDTTPFRTR